MVWRAFCSAAVNSDFSANVELSTPYRLSSDLSSESFIDEISGRSAMIYCNGMLLTYVFGCGDLLKEGAGRERDRN